MADLIVGQAVYEFRAKESAFIDDREALTGPKVDPLLVKAGKRQELLGRRRRRIGVRQPVVGTTPDSMATSQ